MEQPILMRCTFCSTKIDASCSNEFFGFCKRCYSILFISTHPASDRYIPPNKIDEFLWLGPQYSAVDPDPLLKLGIKHIVRIGDDIEVEPLDGLSYYIVEIEDIKTAKISDHFDGIIEYISKAIAKAEGVLVHCKAGLSRSATAVLAYVMTKKRLNLEAAIGFVKNARPGITPNQGFMEQLKELDKTLITRNAHVQ